MAGDHDGDLAEMKVAWRGSRTQPARKCCIVYGCSSLSSLQRNKLRPQISHMRVPLILSLVDRKGRRGVNERVGS